jgi:hypothetical protein
MGHDTTVKATGRAQVEILDAGVGLGNSNSSKLSSSSSAGSGQDKPA